MGVVCGVWGQLSQEGPLMVKKAISTPDSGGVGGGPVAGGLGGRREGGLPVQESLPLAPGQDVAHGVLSVNIAWVEGHGAGRGPQGQGWGGTEAGREFQLAPSLPSNRPGSAEGLGLEESSQGSGCGEGGRWRQ